MEDAAQMHVVFLENQIRYHESQIGWSADNPVKQKQHFALMSGMRGAADYIKNHSNPTTPPSENNTHDGNSQIFKPTNKDLSTVATKNRVSRLPRGEPKFEILRNKLLALYDRGNPDRVAITETDFKLIVKAFAEEADASGRILWSKEALKDLQKSRSGIHEQKVQIVRKFLIQAEILEAETQATIYIVNQKTPLSQQADAAWTKLKNSREKA